MSAVWVASTFIMTRLQVAFKFSIILLFQKYCFTCAPELQLHSPGQLLFLLSYPFTPEWLGKTLFSFSPFMIMLMCKQIVLCRHCQRCQTAICLNRTQVPWRLRGRTSSPGFFSLCQISPFWLCLEHTYHVSLVQLHQHVALISLTIVIHTHYKMKLEGGK